jgi:hypothetical protein
MCTLVYKLLTAGLLEWFTSANINEPTLTEQACHSVMLVANVRPEAEFMNVQFR